MADILIENGAVLTMDKDRRLIDHGTVVIEGNSIVAVGKTSELKGKYRAEKVIDATHKVVMPGLIDPHGHPGGLVRDIGQHLGGAMFETYYPKGGMMRIKIWVWEHAASNDFWHVSGLMAGLERLKFGTTCGVTAEKSFYPGYADSYCKAVEKIGTRDVFSLGHGGPFPIEFTVWDGDRKVDVNFTFDEYMKGVEKVIEKWHGAANGRISIRIHFPNPINPRIVDQKDLPELIEQHANWKKLAVKHNTGITMDGIGSPSIKFYYDNIPGFLGPDVCSDDWLNLTDEEIQIVAKTGAAVAHDCYAWQSIRRRCPVPELIDAGATVGLSSDAATIDRTFDLFKDMKHCMHYHRRHFKDPWYMPPGKVLEMATIDAAKGVQMQDQIGSIEPGKRADVILLNMWQPHLVPFDMIPYRLACRATGHDVDTTIVDGKVLMEGRVVKTVDEMEVLDRAQKEYAKMLDRSGLEPFTYKKLPDGFWGSSYY